MSNRMWLKPPILFVSFSFAIGVLNFLDTFVRLIYSFMVRAPYPLGVYLKPVFFLAQTVSLILFIRSVRFTQNPFFSETKLSRFFSAHLVLIVVVILLYVDFQFLALAGMSVSTAFLQLAFYLTYLVALTGTSFWFAFELLKWNKWKWMFIVFILIGLAFVTAFLEPVFFWSQNYVGFVFPSELSLVVTYAPHILMFFASMSSIAILFLQTSVKNSPFWFRFALLLLVPSLLLPMLWDGYKDGLINFMIRDVIYWGFGYSGSQWYSVSFYLMSFVAYIIMWKAVSKCSHLAMEYSLIAWGVASFPWNGVVPLKVSYSSIPANVISLSSIITGASLLVSHRGES